MRHAHGCDTRAFSERAFRSTVGAMRKLHALAAAKSRRQIAERWTESGMGQRFPALPQMNRLVTLRGRVADSADDGRTEQLFTVGRRLHYGWNSSACRRVAVASVCGRPTHSIRTAAGPDISSPCGKSWSGGPRRPACPGILPPSSRTNHWPRTPE